MSTPSPTPDKKGSTSATTAPAPSRGAIKEQLEDSLNRIHKLLGDYASAIEVTPGLHLSRAECNTIEEITGLGTTRTPADLVKAVERLASIRIGDVRLPFTPGQLEELQHRARKRGHSVEQEMRAVVGRIEDELFYHGA
jgi:hypothetical protein